MSHGTMADCRGQLTCVARSLPAKTGIDALLRSKFCRHLQLRSAKETIPETAQGFRPARYQQRRELQAIQWYFMSTAH